MGWVKSMPGDVGDFSVNIGLGINFLAFVSQFVTLRDTLTYVDESCCKVGCICIYLLCICQLNSNVFVN